MLKPYNVRLVVQDINAIDKLEGCRSDHIRSAITNYLHDGTQSVYNVDVLDILKGQIEDLKADKQYLQQRLDAFTVIRLPLLQRIITRLQS